MKKSYWKIVDEVIASSDIILEIVDARFPEESRNQELEDKVNRAKKKLIVVLNKCDLVSKDLMDRVKKTIPNSVFVSSKKNYGTTILRKMILKVSKNNNITVGVTGYPNTGKSTLINMLKHSAAAGTSSKSGFTRGKQQVLIDQNIMLIDTPGVLAYREVNESKLALLNARTAAQVREPDVPAMEIIRRFKKENPKAFEDYYHIKIKDDPYETLEEIGRITRNFKKKEEININAVAKKILEDWQKGKIVL